MPMGGCGPRSTSVGALRIWLNDTNVGKSAEMVTVVEAIPHDPLVRDVEADVVHVDLNLLSGLPDEDATLQGSRVPGLEGLQQVGESAAGIENVLDDEHVLARDVDPGVHDQPHAAREVRAVLVAGKGDEVDASRPLGIATWQTAGAVRNIEVCRIDKEAESDEEWYY